MFVSMNNHLINDNLFCTNYKEVKRTFSRYRGFRLGNVKLLVEYIFPGFILKIEQNNRDLRYDIFLRKNNKETNEEINLKEVERFRKFYGKGFNIIL